jgi:cytochrome c-type biogenesis protein CcmE
MTRKQRRGVLIVIGFALVSVSVGLVLWAMQGSVTYFKSASDVASSPPTPGYRFRLGGLVEAYRKGPGAILNFQLTDCVNSLSVTYDETVHEPVPDLFREGQGAIAEGSLGPDGVFIATKVLAKHDEKYMPPEVGSALKKSGGCQKQVGQPKSPGT